MRDHKFLQFVFFCQWRDLKTYANRKGIGIIGDMPLYVAHDSADVWVEPELFGVSRTGQLSLVAGCPPDAVLKSGQRWGNPVYDWPRHRATGFRWWLERIGAGLRLYDYLRIDHFIGLTRYWAIPHRHRTAARGHWCRAFGAELLAEARQRFGTLPLIAEDLGPSTPSAVVLRERYELPGMRILQYSFSSPDPSWRPTIYPVNCVAYTGTHDNDTLLGWWRRASPQERETARACLGLKRAPRNWDFLELLWRSPARFVIAPLQDILNLGSEARMNTFGVTSGNWRWRCRRQQLTRARAGRLRSLTARRGRSGSRPARTGDFQLRLP